MSGLSWLHLSDWHQRGPGFDRVKVRDALLGDIRRRADIGAELRALDFLVFSGDLAYRGLAEEYHAAREHFLEPVLQAAGVPRERLFLVPGNHDLERELLEVLPHDLWRTLRDSDKVHYWLTNERRQQALLQPLGNYTAFVSDYLGWGAGDEPAYGYVR